MVCPLGGPKRKEVEQRVRLPLVDRGGGLFHPHSSLAYCPFLFGPSAHVGIKKKGGQGVGRVHSIVHPPSDWGPTIFGLRPGAAAETASAWVLEDQQGRARQLRHRVAVHPLSRHSGECMWVFTQMSASAANIFRRKKRHMLRRTGCLLCSFCRLAVCCLWFPRYLPGGSFEREGVRGERRTRRVRGEPLGNHPPAAAS